MATVSPSQLAPLVNVESHDFDVRAAVEAARTVARERGKERVLWYLPPDDVWVTPELEAMGVVNDEAPGFEAVADALALERTPAGEVSPDVRVDVVTTWEQYRDSYRVMVVVFGVPDLAEPALRERWARYEANTASWKFVCASIGDRIVGMGATGFTPVGLTLSAGCVLPEARGRGVYRAMVHARWQLAVDHGTPALVIQAGRMSRPICERMGFEYVGTILTYVDRFSS